MKQLALDGDGRRGRFHDRSRSPVATRCPCFCSQPPARLRTSRAWIPSRCSSTGRCARSCARRSHGRVEVASVTRPHSVGVGAMAGLGVRSRSSTGEVSSRVREREDDGPRAAAPMDALHDRGWATARVPAPRQRGLRPSRVERSKCPRRRRVRSWCFYAGPDHRLRGAPERPRCRRSLSHRRCGWASSLAIRWVRG